VPSELKGKRIISLSSTTLTAGTIYRGQLEQRVKDICDEVAKSPDIIIFIDEFHSAVSGGSDDIAQMLKPSLSRGELTLIAGTTYDEYKKFIEKDSALKRRFQKVYIEEPEREETFLILQGLRDKYSEYHNVEYSDDVLRACVEWSEKYLYDRNSPDRAIDLMDVSGSRAKLDRPSDSSKITALEEKIEKSKAKKTDLVKKEKYEEAEKERKKQKDLEAKLEEIKATRKRTSVELSDVARVVSELVNIPVEKIMDPDIEKLRSMSGLLKDRIIGQDESIEAVTKLLSKQFLGLRDENIPPSLYI
jgi:ATP-dependent Clp protease ATP-binding subunit ClpC